MGNLAPLVYGTPNGNSLIRNVPLSKVRWGILAPCSVPLGN